MRVSELAKELGYKAAELVELAKAKGIKVEDARANIDARLNPYAPPVRLQPGPSSVCAAETQTGWQSASSSSVF